MHTYNEITFSPTKLSKTQKFDNIIFDSGTGKYAVYISDGSVNWYNQHRDQFSNIYQNLK